MSRHRPGGGHGHHIQRLGRDDYRISWAWDRYYPSSRLRFPQTVRRDTNLAGAVRFAKKWNLTIPEDQP